MDTKIAMSADQYWGDSELEQVTSCLACGNTTLSPCYRELEDLLGELPGRWGFISCDSCAALNLDPRPTQAAIVKAYPANYVTHFDGKRAHTSDNGEGILWSACNGYLNRRFGATREPELSFLAPVLRLIPPIRLQLDYFYRNLPRSAGSLLDVGCGNGAFLLRARDAGWRVLGLEPDPDAVRAARAGGVEVINTTIDGFTAESEFDQVTLSHVFEHLHQPADSLRRILSWLKPNGRIWMALPNPEGIGHRIFARNWFSLDPPRHICIPTQDRVRRMLEEVGFVGIRFHRRGRGARSSISPSLQYAHIRKNWPLMGALPLTALIDVLASIHPIFSEETIVTGRRPR